MNYYKIIYENEVVGVVSSKNFIQYVPKADCFARCDETQGEYISYAGQLYRDAWMNPTKIQRSFLEAKIRPISKEEYDSFINAISSNQKIEDLSEEDVIVETPVIVDPVEEASIEYIRSSKLKEMSYTCRTTIENGFDLELRGELRHFSLDTQDQLNLISLSAMAQMQEYIPYHADGEECIFYTAEEMNAIVATATAFKIYHTTYYNALKAYINSLETLEDIAAIEYGTPIPEEYQSDVLKSLQ